MKKGILFLLILLLSLSNLLSQKQLEFSAIADSTGTIISSRVLIEAYNRLNIKINVTEYPGIRALKYSNGGDFDGEVNRIAGIDSEYTNLIRVPIPICKLEAVAFTKDVKFTIDGWESLIPYRVGIRRGSIFSSKGTESISGIHTFVANTEEQLFHLLENGRVDVIITPRVSGFKYLKSNDVYHISTLEPPIETYPLYHYLHKKNEYLLPKISTVLKELEIEGFIDRTWNEVLMEQFGQTNIE